ncbi:uncharacterized protein LOC132303963 [Cornus florida]|uniref:uncharacterized protein LOC132303963 n=1 Tax=Cornus florida TaxID=4283 RepID=UPI002898AEE6|nr:uncharacterized protein LOC132303963 [Cornus florida]
MSNSENPLNQTLEHQSFDLSPNIYSHESQEWEAIARAWLSTMPEGKTLTMSEVEAWLDSNHAFLPDHIKTMAPSELYDRLTLILNSTETPNKDKDVNQVDLHQARFQRTDQWMPVYSWLESLDADEVIKSKDILDWLSENAEVREQLYSRHSRYHLMHYIKKCHVKILKRKEKKKGLQPTSKEDPVKVHKNEGIKLPVPLPSNALNNLPKDSDIYLTKRNEAFRKYEILIELEKQLYTILPKRENANNLESKNPVLTEQAE